MWACGGVCSFGGPTIRILVVEDDPTIASAVRSALAGEGWATDVVGNGPDALEWADQYPYDLIVLDLVLPGMGGLDVCSALRAAGVAAPILILTARDAIEDRVAGLDRGADDYLAKPFAMAELMARIRALRRRQVPDRGPTLRVSGLELDPASRAVSRHGQAIRLTAREFALLEFLVRNAGQVFTRDRLIDAVWDAEYAPESNIVEVYIRSLRRKIDGGRRDGIIETVRGAGYRVSADLRIED